MAAAVMMSCRDRTSEFQSTIRSFQSRMVKTLFFDFYGEIL
jgi:hypothetical protein